MIIEVDIYSAIRTFIQMVNPYVQSPKTVAYQDRLLKNTVKALLIQKFEKATRENLRSYPQCIAVRGNRSVGINLFGFCYC